MSKNCDININRLNIFFKSSHHNKPKRSKIPSIIRASCFSWLDNYDYGMFRLCDWITRIVLDLTKRIA